MAEEVVSESVLEEMPDLFAIGSNFYGTKAYVKHPGTVFIGVVAIGADGIGLSAVSIGIVERLSRVMVYSWVSSEDVDPHR